MKEFDYIIIGGGCAGLSLAYELEIFDKLKTKKLAIIEPRTKYQRDKTWSFWKVIPHNFEDCVKKNWKNFSLNFPSEVKHLKCESYPYQTIDSNLFYKKVLNKLVLNKNIKFFNNINDVEKKDAVIFNSVASLPNHKDNIWQHFQGIEIETPKNYFDDKIFNLMDFDCDQRKDVHFFYTLPFSPKTALIETTWLSRMNDDSLKDYDNQLKNYIKDKLKIEDYKINYKEVGAIPLFYPNKQKNSNVINIGTAGGMTRLSTGYTFLNIQEQSKYLRQNLENIKGIDNFEMNKKYQFLDKIFLKVLKNNPEKMVNIFQKMFKVNETSIIKFLSNKSDFKDDLSIILKMPKWTFIKALM